jgi:hypothetical protein
MLVCRPVWATTCATEMLRMMTSVLCMMMRALFRQVAAARCSRSVVDRPGRIERDMSANLAGIKAHEAMIVVQAVEVMVLRRIS